MSDFTEWAVIMGVSLLAVVVIILALAWAERRRVAGRHVDDESFRRWITSLGVQRATDGELAPNTHPLTPVAPVLQYREYAEALCAELTRRCDYYERTYGDCDSSHDEPALVEFDSRYVTLGEIRGLRLALCLLHGWDLITDSERGGPADRLAREWQHHKTNSQSQSQSQPRHHVTQLDEREE